jgi:hypothetical protein
MAELAKRKTDGVSVVEVSDYVYGNYLAAGQPAQAELELGFAHPPDAAKPRVYWWWLEGNLSRAGITRDLEEMKRKGIGGALVFDASSGARYSDTVELTPAGPGFMSPEWRALFKHMLEEADRLGLEISLNMGSGWDCGGPWITPAYAAQKLVWSETPVSGPAKCCLILPVPRGVRADLPGFAPFYQDIAVLAVPEEEIKAQPAFRATASSEERGWVAANALDGDLSTLWVSKPIASGEAPAAGSAEWLQVQYFKPLRASAMYLVPQTGHGPYRGQLEYSEDGRRFARLAEFRLTPSQSLVVAFPEIEARWFRLRLCADLSNTAVDTIHNINRAQAAAPRVRIAELLLAPREQLGRAVARMRNWQVKAMHGWTRDIPCDVPADEPGEFPQDRTVDRASVVDLSGRMDRSGRLDWEVPPGRWSILRFGYTPTGIRVSMYSPGGAGLMVDHLSAEAMDFHFENAAGKLLAEVGHMAGRSLKYFHCDSWEVGQVNWTPRFLTEFCRRRGYDPLAYLPALAGRIIGNCEITDRFYYDFRKTVGDCIADNHYGRFRELSHRHGILFHPQSGGAHHVTPLDALKSLGRNDIPMGEFWATGNLGAKRADAEAMRFLVRPAAMASHIYGKRLVNAEAFTTLGPHWEEGPLELKPVADRAFCEGANRFFFHTFTHSPAEAGRPGYEYYAGTHFNPQITWWEQADAWTTYIARCQFLLQQGLPVADLCYYYGDQVPNSVPLKHVDPALGPGYDYDVTNAEALVTRMSVDRGRILLPDGMSYALLVLPDRETISLEVLRKISELVQGGGTIVGPRPSRATGLRDYPQCDPTVRGLAETVWGPCDGKAAREHRWGKGRVIWGKKLREILAADGLPPDFEANSEAGNPTAPSLDWIHRRDGQTDIYFVSNQAERAQQAECVFRVSGRQPEIWDPVTGQRTAATDWRAAGARTAVPLQFTPRQSCFVVFRQPAEPPQAVRPNFPVLRAAIELTGAWTVKFDPRWGGPPSVVFPRLDDWTMRPEPGIKYYSGKATYEKTFDLPEHLRQPARRLYLHLGKVSNLAEVRLNGTNLGVVWTAPWRVEITAADQPTDNRLQIDVVNLWPNRLIGDGKLPPEKRFTKTNVQKFYRPPKTGGEHKLLESGLLGPVTLQATQPTGTREGVGSRSE